MTLRTVLIVMLIACGKKNGGAPAAGSGSAPPPPPPPDAAAPKIVVDAAPQPTFDQKITADGVGPIKADTDPTKLGELFPGTKVDVDHFEGEATVTDTYKVSTNGAPLLEAKVDGNRDPKKIAFVTIVSSAFATRDMLRIGSTVANLAAVDPYAVCKRATYHTGDNENPPEFTHTFECASKNLANVTFYLDETKPGSQGQDGTVVVNKIAQEKFVRIVWTNPSLTAP